MKREERNTLIAVVLAGIVTIVLGSLSAVYLDRVLGGALRGTDWDFLLFPGVVMLVCGSGWVWYVVYSKIVDWLDMHL